MTNTPKALSRGLLTGSSATLYTVPASTTAIITNIVLANTSASATTATLSFDGVVLVPTVPVEAHSIVAFDISQPLATTKTITGLAGTGAVVACHIAGVEQA